MVQSKFIKLIICNHDLNVTGFGKTNLDVTFYIFRNTILTGVISQVSLLKGWRAWVSGQAEGGYSPPLGHRKVV